MKLLSLRLNGINSIQSNSPTLIDLENSEFAQRGLFAITGPTGSGKTTILDAISLALYGRTPRVETVSQGTAHEVVNKRSVKANAEVEYEVEGVRYKSSWSVHRAEMKLSGQFQNPKVSLSIKEGDVWSVLQSQKKSWEEENVKRLGIDFKNFQYAVVLAQGQFSKFIQAKDSERAEILKELTHTDQFSIMGAKCWEVKQKHQTELESLTAHLDTESVSLFNEAQLEEMNQSVQVLNQKLSKVQQDYEQAERWRHLEVQWDQLQIEGKQQLEAQHEFEVRKSAFEDKQAKLNEFRKIEKLIPLDEEIKSLEEKIQLAQNTQEEQLREQSGLLKKIDETEDKWMNFQTEFSIHQRAIQENKVWQDQIRGPQIRLDTLSELKSNSEAQWQSRKEDLSVWTEEMSDLEKEIESIQSNLGNVHKWLELYPMGDSLKNQLRIWLSELSQELNQCEQIQLKETKLSDLKKSHQILKEKLQNLEKEFEPQRKELSTYHQKKESLKDELGDDRSKTENRRSELETLSHQLTQKLEALKEKARFELDYAQHQEELRENQENQLRLNQESTQVTQNLTTTRQLKNSRKDLLETKREILKLSAYKHLVEKGKPCPLCNGMDHEDFQHSAPEDLQQFEKDLEEAQSKYDQALDDEKNWQAKLNKFQFEQKELQHKMTSLENEISREAGSLSYQDQLSIAQNEFKEHEDKFDKFHQELKKIENKDVELRHLKREILLLEDAAKDKEEAIESAKESLKRSQWEIESLDQELSDLRTWLDISNKKWIGRVQGHLFNGWKGSLQFRNYDDRKLFEKEGSSWLQEFEEKQRQDKDLKAQLQSTQLRHRQLKARGTEIENKYKLAEKSHHKNLEDFKKSEDQLQELLQGKVPEEITHALENESLKLEEYKERLESKRAHLQKEKTHIEATLSAKKSEITSQNKQCDSKRLQFEQQLKALGIEGREDFRTRLIDETSLNNIQETEKKNREEEIRLREVKESISLREKKCLSELSQQWSRFREDEFDPQLRYAKAVKEGLDKDIRAVQEEIWGVENKLKENEHLKEKLGDLYLEIDQKKSELHRWTQLESLIGQKTGAVFNKVAQSLNLKRLLILANQFLEQLRSRYELVVDDSQDPHSLSMMVIDSEQDGIKRPLSNLSGGESFQLALALALGLSEISSGAAQVDSLFIDEGFGTLDQETLANVLIALQSLKASGKTVGIITHVNGIREYIPGGLELKVNSGGRGEIHVVEP